MTILLLFCNQLFCYFCYCEYSALNSKSLRVREELNITAYHVVSFCFAISRPSRLSHLSRSWLIYFLWMYKRCCTIFIAETNCILDSRTVYMKINSFSILSFPKYTLSLIVGKVDWKFNINFVSVSMIVKIQSFCKKVAKRPPIDFSVRNALLLLGGMKSSLLSLSQISSPLNSLYYWQRWFQYWPMSIYPFAFPVLTFWSKAPANLV